MLVAPAVPANLLDERDVLRLKLHAPAAPFYTNGNWNNKERFATWQHSMEPASAKKPGLPLVLYAVWSEPNEETQKQLFTKMILRDEALGRYVMWYGGLQQPEQQAWGNMLASLKGHGIFRLPVRTFHMPGDRSEYDNEIADLGRTLLLEAFKEHSLR